MTPEALAKEAGISRGYLARLETGRHDPTISMLRTLAKAAASVICIVFSVSGSLVDGYPSPRVLTMAVLGSRWRRRASSASSSTGDVAASRTPGACS
jgi:transcriptional regulator with XRE-family HTH domain